MKTETAIKMLTDLGKAVVKVDTIKEANADLHRFISGMVYQEDDHCANDIYDMSVELMQILFAFGADSFSAEIVNYRNSPRSEKYDCLVDNAGKEGLIAFVKLVYSIQHN